MLINIQKNGAMGEKNVKSKILKKDEKKVVG